MIHRGHGRNEGRAETGTQKPPLRPGSGYKGFLKKKTSFDLFSLPLLTHSLPFAVLVPRAGPAGKMS